jgi:hypothetical protein
LKKIGEILGDDSGATASKSGLRPGGMEWGHTFFKMAMRELLRKTEINKNDFGSLFRVAQPPLQPFANTFFAFFGSRFSLIF